MRKSSAEAVDEFIYQSAAKLSDKGYGSFDRCLQVFRACKGDFEETEKVLSKLIFKEYKKEA
jgi:hypothetical protein